MKSEKRLQCSDVGTYIGLTVVAILVVLFCSFSTSPLYPYYWGSDSAQFQTIGKAWAMGKIPYSEIFDHKGPFIFWVNMLGYKIMDRTGIFILQIIFMFFTLIAAYKIFGLALKNTYIKWLGIICFILILMDVYSGGNMCEEYCLPFLMFCTYGQFSFFIQFNNRPEHNIFLGLFYGVSVAICFLTRATNAIAVICGILLITIMLISKSRYKNLVYNVIAFFSGFMIVFFPFAMYFQLQGAFGDFLFGTFGYNIIYIYDKASKNKNYINLEYWVTYIRVFLPAAMCVPALLLTIKNKRKYCAWYFLIVGLCENYLFCRGELYSHYAIITLPNITVFIVELAEVLKNRSNQEKTLVKRTMTLCIIICLVISFSFKYKEIYNKLSKYSSSFVEYEDLMVVLPKEEYGNIMVYGGGSLKDFYLRYDIDPCYKYFVLQDAQGKRSQYVSRDIYSEFDRCEAKWILTDDNTNIISNILNSKYCKYSEQGKYMIYRLLE